MKFSLLSCGFKHTQFILSFFVGPLVPIFFGVMCKLLHWNLLHFTIYTNENYTWNFHITFIFSDKTRGLYLGISATKKKKKNPIRASRVCANHKIFVHVYLRENTWKYAIFWCSCFHHKQVFSKTDALVYIYWIYLFMIFFCLIPLL